MRPNGVIRIPSPNSLFPVTYQMQARGFEPVNPCQLPGLDRLAAGGVRFRRAYTPLRVTARTQKQFSAYSPVH